MPTYISMFKFTPQGLASVKDFPKVRAANRQALEAMGGKLLGVYLTMGRYDQVTIFEAPDDTTAAKLLLRIGGQGNLTTETMRAFPEEEYDQIATSLA